MQIAQEFLTYYQNMWHTITYQNNDSLWQIRISEQKFSSASELRRINP